MEDNTAQDAQLEIWMNQTKRYKPKNSFDFSENTSLILLYNKAKEGNIWTILYKSTKTNNAPNAIGAILGFAIDENTIIKNPIKNNIK